MKKSLVLIVLVLGGCYTAPQLQNVNDQGTAVPCTGVEPSCRGMSVQISIEEDKDIKLTKSDQKQKHFFMFGRCDLVVETADHSKAKYPCTELRISLLRKSTGEERNTWLQGSSFEIRDLTRGPYLFKVYSDQYMVGTTKDKVPPGKPMRIEIRLTEPGLKSATAM